VGNTLVNNDGTLKNSRQTVKKKHKRKIGLKNIETYALLLPAMTLLFVFHYIPIYGILIAFKDFNPYQGMFGGKWVGLKYFKMFLTNDYFWKVVRNTLILNGYSLIFGFVAPIILALLINEVVHVRPKKIIQTVSYLPYFISWVVVSGMVISILSPNEGIVNIILSKAFGIEPIYFLGEPNYFRSIVTAVDIWKNMGMQSVYYLAAMMSINPELYEATSIDGGGRWRQTWHITLPGIKPTIVILFILQVGGLASIGFDRIFLFYNSLVYDVGDVISTYTYRMGLEGLQFSSTTAIGLTQSVINFIMVYTANKLSKSYAGWSMW
jgi:putative aldouronate transport system permease protein